MAGGVFSTALLNAMTIRESATDGSDFTNPAADYRRLFLGEDGQLHVKDSAGAVTDIGGAVSEITDIPTAETDTALRLAPDGAGGVEWGTGGSGGDYARSNEIVAAAGGVANFDFTSIPGTGRHLVIEMLARSEKTANFDTVLLRFNNDSSAIYTLQLQYSFGSTSGAQENISQTSIIVAAEIPAASATAGLFAYTRIFVPYYANTFAQKIGSINSFEPLNETTGSGRQTKYTAIHWRSTSAIDRVTLFTAANDFAENSSASLYLID